MLIFEKILTPILSSIVLAIFLTLGSEYFYAVVLFSLPVFLIGGTLFSLFVDYLITRTKIQHRFYQYLTALILYGLGGILIIVLYALLQGAVLEITLLALLILGVLPGWIYYHLNLILNTVFSLFYKLDI